MGGGGAVVAGGTDYAGLVDVEIAIAVVIGTGEQGKGVDIAVAARRAGAVDEVVAAVAGGVLSPAHPKGQPPRPGSVSAPPAELWG